MLCPSEHQIMAPVTLFFGVQHTVFVFNIWWPTYANLWKPPTASSGLTRSAKFGLRSQVERIATTIHGSKDLSDTPTLLSNPL